MLVSRGPLPTGPSWAYEVKWDGIRGQVALREGAVTVRSRPGRDLSESFPELSEPPPTLAGRDAVLDGEIVWLDSDGHPDFAAVRARLIAARPHSIGCLAFMAFDLLSLAGEPLTDRPYSERRELLEGLSLQGPTSRVPRRLMSQSRCWRRRTTRALRESSQSASTPPTSPASAPRRG